MDAVLFSPAVEQALAVYRGAVSRLVAATKAVDFRRKGPGGNEREDSYRARIAATVDQFEEALAEAQAAGGTLQRTLAQDIAAELEEAGDGVRVPLRQNARDVANGQKPRHADVDAA